MPHWLHCQTIYLLSWNIHLIAAVSGSLLCSDINDLEEDCTSVDTTESTAYYESSTSTIVPDDSMPAEKQPKYLVFKSALLLLFNL